MKKKQKKACPRTQKETLGPFIRAKISRGLNKSKRFYEVFPPANLRRGPNPGLKLAAAYFSRKEIVRLYRRSRLI